MIILPSRKLIKPTLGRYARNAKQSAHPELWGGLAGAWVPALGVQGGQVFDVSGNNNDGTLTNMDIGADWVVSGKEYGINFDSNNDAVRLEGPGNLAITTGSFTFVAKYELTAAPSAGSGILSRSDDGTAVTRDASIDFGGAGNNKLTFQLYDGSNNPFARDTVSSVGSINTVMGVRDTRSGLILLYKNGALIASATDTSGNLDGPGLAWAIGRRLDNAGGTFNGNIFSCFYYRRALPGNFSQLFNIDHLAPLRLSNSPISFSISGGPTLLNGSVSVQGFGDLTSLPSTKLSSSASLSGTANISAVPTLIRNSLIILPSRKLINPTLGRYARNAKQSAHPELWEGLVGAWEHHLGVQGETIYDISGFNRDGDLLNHEASDWGVASFGGSQLDHDGSDEYVNIPDIIDLSFSRGTIVWYINPDLAFNDGVEAGHKFWGQMGGNVPEFSAQKFSDNKFYIGWNQSGNDDRVSLAASAKNYIQNEWNLYHLTWVSGGFSRLYHNGIEIGNNSGSTSIVNIGKPLRIARQGSRASSSANFNGKYGFFRLYNKAMIAPEVSTDWIDPFGFLRLADSPIPFVAVGGPNLLNGSVSVQGFGDLTSLPSLISNGSSQATGDSLVVSSLGFISFGLVSSTGVGSITQIPSLILNSNPGISGDSSLLASGGFLLSGVSSNIGIGDLTETPSTIFGGIGSLQGIDSITTLTSEILGGLSLTSGDGLLSGAGSLLGTSSGVASASGFGDVSAIASLTANALASVTGNGQLTSTSSFVLNTLSSLDGTSILSGVPSILANSQVSVSGEGSASVITSFVKNAIASLNGTGSATTLPTTIRNSSISVSGNSILQGLGILGGFSAGVGTLLGTSNITSVGSVTLGGVASVLGEAVVSSILSGTLSSSVSVLGEGILTGTTSAIGTLQIHWHPNHWHTNHWNSRHWARYNPGVQIKPKKNQLTLMGSGS